MILRRLLFVLCLVACWKASMAQCPVPIPARTQYNVTCGGTVTVQATSPAEPGTIHRWWSSVVNGVLLYQGGAVSGGEFVSSASVAANESRVVYVESYNSSTACTSTRSAVSIVIGPSISLAGAQASLCTNSPNVVLSASEGTSYRWIAEGFPIEGASQRTFMPQARGLYQVQIGSTCGQKVVTYALPEGKPLVRPETVVSSCGAGYKEFSAVSSLYATDPVTEHRWYTTPGGTEKVDVTVTTTSPLFTTMIGENFPEAKTYNFYVSAVNGCGEGPRERVWIDIFEYSNRAVAITPSGNPELVSNLEDFTLTATPGFQYYNWYFNGQPVSGIQGATYTPTASGTYRVDARMNYCQSVSSSIFVSFQTETNAQPQMSRVITKTMKVAVGRDEAVPSDLAAVEQSTTYYDGLGRPRQEVLKRESPYQHDVVRLRAYDNQGREPLTYLPYAYGVSGYYKPGALGEDGQLNEYYQYDAPYAEVEYEKSPASRVIKETGPGAAWRTQNKWDVKSYHVNRHGTSAGEEQIIAWTLSAEGTLERRSPLAGYVESGGYYSTGQLTVNILTDSEGKYIREYYNKVGKLIAKKVRVAATENLNDLIRYAQTYYLYDDYGNLTVVLPPEAVKNLLSAQP